MKDKIVLFTDGDINIVVQINPEQETVWLTQKQMEELFDVKHATVSEHITNILASGELDETSVGLSDKSSGGRKPKIYNLDMILSVGYRVNSKRGIAFRKCAMLAVREKGRCTANLDIMMPGLSGYQTCVEIRQFSNASIFFLSAKSQEDDKMLGFSSGGDDYLVKPFSYNELVSRTKALIRRYHVYQGKVIELTDTEYALLHLLVTNRRQIFSAEHLYESVWQETYYYGANNTVMVHMRNLRRKIERDPKNPTIIKTVWGRGYRCDYSIVKEAKIL